MHRSVVATGGVVLLAALGLAACTEQNTTSGQVEPGQQAPRAVEDQSAPDSGSAPTAQPNTAAQRALIRTASLVVVSENLSAAEQAVTAIASKAGGFVTSVSGSMTPGSGPAGATCPRITKQGAPDGSVIEQPCPPVPVGDEWVTVTIRVPAAKYQPSVDAISALGDVASLSATATDVTEQQVDLDARIEVQQASVRRVKALLDRATSLSDVVRIEQELTTRQAELESLQARRRSLADQVAMSTITATVTTPDSLAAFVPESQRPWWSQTWQAFTTSWSYVAIGLAGMSPLLVLIVAGVLLAWWLARRNARAAARRESGVDPTSSAAGE